MMGYSLRIYVLLFGICTLLSTELRGQVSSTDASDRLRRRVEMAPGADDLSAGSERIHTQTSVARFYEDRAFELAWTSGGAISPNVGVLIEEIRQSEDEGMRPGDYHLRRIEGIVEQIRSYRSGASVPAGLLADLDLLCTDAFLLQASHRLGGRVDPETIDREWFANRRSRDLVRLLEEALSEANIAATLDELLPSQTEYNRLRGHLQKYRQIELSGGWPVIPGGSKMQLGDEGERVALLKQRLAREEYPVVGVESPEARFDEALDAAVRMFQERHGLDVDGVVGSATLRALNVSAGARARQIALNMERWRWLPQDLGQRHVIVNIAGYWLEVVENQETVLDMRVIVGRSYRRTPVFSDRISYLVFNPYWNVPPGIAAKDILPQVKQDPSYLARQNMTLFSGWGADARVVDPQTVDWSRVTATNFPYRIRQEPGPNNALGTVKFMFPNRFSVYLHDTPARELFARSVRTFSSGCIRVEKPVELAAYLLQDQSGWASEKIRSLSGGTTEQTVRLTRPVPVHLLYWTAWVDDEGQIEFRDDVYGRDLILDNALQEKPPALRAQ